jgi:hypothetical protein
MEIKYIAVFAGRPQKLLVSFSSRMPLRQPVVASSATDVRSKLVFLASARDHDPFVRTG